ncbi:MAG: hypothetical protein AUK35_01825 [Zetaproteobacteria bacterium CG2_30_46_52]|nr:MAG: hypothetical protein AUK35_01825 [Zetaproteobacteria bacterium CG2_30_46_52]
MVLMIRGLSVMMVMLLAGQVHAERLDAVAAVVNGEAITCSEVEMAYQGLKSQLKEQGVASLSEEVLQQRAMDSRVMRTLQYQEAQSLEMKVSPAEVDAAIAEVETRNNLQPGQLEAALLAQGVDMDTYRETLEDKLLSGRIINVAVRSKISVSEEAMREYYRKYLQDPQPVREVRIAQVFVALPPDAKSDVVERLRLKAQDALQRLHGGENFERLVAMASDAPNATEGGDMGWVSPGAVSGGFMSIFNLNVGDYSDVIRSSAGFHVIKVTQDRVQKPENMLPYEEVHARHILLQVPESADMTTQLKIRERAEHISSEMQGTSDDAFAVRAKELSQGPSASRGGDLGWFKRGQMVGAFDEVVFAMQPGETSKVVTTQFGLHVIRLIEKRTINPNAFEAHKDNIERLLMDAELQQQVPRWMNELKDKATIVYKQCAPVSASVKEVVADQVGAPEKAKDEVVVEQKISPEDALQAWAKAWAAKDLDAYFAAYDASVSPDSRYDDFSTWQAYKRRVINGNNDIAVTLSHVAVIEMEDGKSATVTFDQHFKSNKFDDNDKKIIKMIWLDAQWKIVSEATIKTPK